MVRDFDAGLHVALLQVGWIVGQDEDGVRAHFDGHLDGLGGRGAGIPPAVALPASVKGLLQPFEALGLVFLGGVHHLRREGLCAVDEHDDVELGADVHVLEHLGGFGQHVLGDALGDHGGGDVHADGDGAGADVFAEELGVGIAHAAGQAAARAAPAAAEGPDGAGPGIHQGRVAQVLDVGGLHFRHLGQGDVGRGLGDEALQDLGLAGLFLHLLDADGMLQLAGGQGGGLLAFEHHLGLGRDDHDGQRNGADDEHDVDQQRDQDGVEGAFLLRGVFVFRLGEGGPDGKRLHERPPISMSNVQCPRSNTQVNSPGLKPDKATDARRSGFDENTGSMIRIFFFGRL